MRQKAMTGAPMRSEPKLGNACAYRPSMKRGDRQHFGAGYHALTATAVNANLEHREPPAARCSPAGNGTGSRSKQRANAFSHSDREPESYFDAGQDEAVTRGIACAGQLEARVAHGASCSACFAATASTPKRRTHSDGTRQPADRRRGTRRTRACESLARPAGSDCRAPRGCCWCSSCGSTWASCRRS